MTYDFFIVLRFYRINHIKTIFRVLNTECQEIKIATSTKWGVWDGRRERNLLKRVKICKDRIRTSVEWRTVTTSVSYKKV